MIRSTAFQRLIHPRTEQEFFHRYWEKEPLLIKGDSCFSSIYSYNKLKETIEAQNLLYTINLNVCKCVDNEKQMLEQYPNEVSLFEVEQYFEKHKATLQVLQPQQHTPELAELLSDIEAHFGCLVGSNVYITPPKSKGLAPHYDDVEVFIIQLEGKKNWKIHKPILELPNSCSGDLSPEEIDEPTYEIQLEKGDVLYFPRGWIHHAETTDEMSTHITISTYQKHSYSDLLELALPIALEELKRSDVDYRRGLPLRVFSSAGFANALPGAENPQYESLEEVSKKLVAKLTKTIGIALHEAADMMSVDFMEHRLPPSETQLERALGQYRELLNDGHYGPLPDSPECSVRLLDPSLIRLVLQDGESSGGEHEGESSDDSELDDFGCSDIRDPFQQGAQGFDGNEDEAPDLVPNEDSSSDSEEMDDEQTNEPTALVFFSTQNAIHSHMGPEERDQNCLRFSLDLVPAISQLIHSFPKFMKIKDISRSETQEISSIQGMVVALWSCGILICEPQTKKRKNRQSDKDRKRRRLK